MKLFKISGYLLEANAQTIENLEWTMNRQFDTRQLHIEESEQFDSDYRLDDENCDLAFLEEHFDHSIKNAFDRELPIPREIWRHFKEGKIVRIVGIAEGTEYHEKSVIYEAEDGSMWSRPLDMFMSLVDREKYPDANQKYRFEGVWMRNRSIDLSWCGE